MQKVLFSILESIILYQMQNHINMYSHAHIYVYVRACCTIVCVKYYLYSLVWVSLGPLLSSLGFNIFPVFPHSFAVFLLSIQSTSCLFSAAAFCQPWSVSSFFLRRLHCWISSFVIPPSCKSLSTSVSQAPLGFFPRK